MVSFFRLFEMLQKKKILVLIHPDCITEVGRAAALQYAGLLAQHLPKFDYVITHLFMEDGRAWGQSWDQETKEAHDRLVTVVKSHSNVTRFDSKDAYCASYSKELPDFLVENPQADIYMAGGYESNCLWLSYLGLFRKLNWLLKEQGHSVYYYKPLLFSDQMGGGLARNRQFPAKDKDDGFFNPAYASQFEPFHPTKVAYKDS